MNEIWKDIPEFEGVYQISNHGRLKKLKCERRPHSYPRIVSVKNGNGWYLTIILQFEGKKKTARIHRLVAEAFIPNPENKLEVNHKDTNKQNNHWSNLEWVSRKENHAHAVKNTDIVKGMNHYNKFVRPNIIVQVSPEGDVIKEFPNACEAARTTGVCNRNILQVAHKTQYKPGKIRKQAGGFIWRFKDAV
ncbi:MAG: hypothetical protein C4586_08635 [Anaerolineaceae bacterium]|nr:MAG: hypothetical protein C4586_08635 [Anaerolineaceae bacterium]